MKITSAVFVKSAFTPEEYPPGVLPEIAFVGRSNVGKSTLINHLTARKMLARTSSTPGKTRLLNFYTINEFVTLVDLPGYGYTKLPEMVSETWRKAIASYFDSRKTLASVFQLIDIRHPPTVLDVKVSHWLRQCGILGATLVVKADKVSRNNQIRNRRNIIEALALSENDSVIIYSALSNIGRTDAWDQILSIIQSSQNAD